MQRRVDHGDRELRRGRQQHVLEHEQDRRDPGQRGWRWELLPRPVQQDLPRREGASRIVGIPEASGGRGHGDGEAAVLGRPDVQGPRSARSGGHATHTDRADHLLVRAGQREVPLPDDPQPSGADLVADPPPRAPVRQELGRRPEHPLHGGNDARTGVASAVVVQAAPIATPSAGLRRRGRADRLQDPVRSAGPSAARRPADRSRSCRTHAARGQPPGRQGGPSSRLCGPSPRRR